MAQEFLPKDIKTYPEATSLEGINLFGHNVATGAGENLPGSKIQEAIDAAGGMFLVTYNTGAGTADKSYTEIATALQAGKSVVLKSISAGGESFYTHTGSGSSGVEFSLVYEGSNGPIIEELTVNPSNVWSETLHQGASKDYVDNAIEGIGKPLTYKGGATVAQLNAGPSGLDSGWVYTCTTAGTLTAGSVEVEIGDEVAWNGTAWEKIGGEGGKAFVVTYDGTGGDKTYAEILAAMSAGKVCLLYDSDWTQFAYGGLIGSGDTIYFYTTRPGSEGLTCTEYSVTSSDVWTRRQISNPGEAPVDNKAYGRWNGTWKEVSLSTPIVQGTVTGGVGQAQLYAMTDFGSLNLSGGVLTINFGSPLSGVLAEGAAEFSLTADNSVGDLVVKIGGNSDCQIINAPASGSWKAGKCYQVTMVDGYCVVGEFPIRTWGTAVIGGRAYKTVTIGTQTWLAENLDYKWDGLTIAAEGTPATPAAWYYNNDETTYGWNGRKCGLLYNGHAMLYLEEHKSTLCPGWHVPSESDISALKATCGQYPGRVLSSTLLPWAPSWDGGTDEFGFSAIPGGIRNDGGGGLFQSVGSSFEAWYTKKQSSSSSRYAIYIGANNQDYMQDSLYQNLTFGASIRLIKD